MKKTKFTKEISRDIEELYRKGCLEGKPIKISDIKKKLISEGIPEFDGMYTRIYYICKTFGDKQRNEGEELGYKTKRDDTNRLKKLVKITDETLEEIYKLKKEGFKVEYISQKFGVNKSTIYRALKRTE